MLSRSTCRTRPSSTNTRLLALAIAAGSLSFVGCASAPAAPGAPATDLHLARIVAGPDGPVIERPQAVTDRPLYDNQPAFSADGRTLYYTEMSDGQTDVVAFRPATGERRYVARTAESEYSPTPIPGEDAVSVVRVEADGRQRLWRLPEGGGAAEPLVPEIEGVGYHAWADDGRALLLFLLGEPTTLELVEVDSGARRRLAENPGRSLETLPDGRVAYLVPAPGGEGAEPVAGTIWAVGVGGEPAALAPALPGSQDFAVGPDGALWMASGTRIHHRPPGASEWREVADVAAWGLGAVSRLAVDRRGERLALVAERSTP